MLNWPRTLCRATPAALLALVCASFAITVSPAMARSHHGHHVVRNHYTMARNRYAVPANPTDPAKDAALISMAKPVGRFIRATRRQSVILRR